MHGNTSTFAGIPTLRLILAVAVGLFLSVALFHQRTCHIAMYDRPRIVLFGDSITQFSFRPSGWGNLLSEYYERKADVVCRGYSGYNTRWAKHMLPKLFPPYKGSPPAQPLIATVFFGANDAAMPDGDSARAHVPLAEYKDNLRHIVADIKASGDGSTLVILIAPPPVDVVARRKYALQLYGDKASGLPDRTNPVTGTYADACREVAAQLGCPVVDLWTAMQAQPDWPFFLSDGLHLTERGNAFVFQQLVEAIKGADAARLPAALPYDFPLNADIDHEDSAAFFRKWEEKRQGHMG
eukprot:jgi/Mesvir1/17389/Mv08688-RA.1